MGIYIKGMDRVSDCMYCLFYSHGYCNAKHGGCNSEFGIDADCPLVEVKTPHGRLIDADIVEEQLKEIEEITAMVDIELGDDPEEGEISIPLFTIRNIHNKAKSVIEAEVE